MELPHNPSFPSVGNGFILRRLDFLDPLGGMGKQKSHFGAWPRTFPLMTSSFRGFPKLGVPTIMENQMEKKMENDMETGIL